MGCNPCNIAGAPYLWPILLRKYITEVRLPGVSIDQPQLGSQVLADVREMNLTAFGVTGRPAGYYLRLKTGSAQDAGQRIAQVLAPTLTDQLLSTPAPLVTKAFMGGALCTLAAMLGGSVAVGAAMLGRLLSSPLAIGGTVVLGLGGLALCVIGLVGVPSVPTRSIQVTRKGFSPEPMIITVPTRLTSEMAIVVDVDTVPLVAIRGTKLGVGAKILLNSDHALAGPLETAWQTTKQCRPIGVWQRISLGKFSSTDEMLEQL